MANELNKVPTSLEAISTFGSGKVPTYVESVWYKFFQSLSSVLSNLVDGVLGFTSDSGATATGVTQGDALMMTTEWIEVTTTPAGSGVMLQPFGPGVPSSVFNQGLNSLKVYPSGGARIDALAINAPYPLPAGKMQVFSQVTNTQWLSTQLG